MERNGEVEVLALYQQMIRADQDAVLRFMRVRVSKYGEAAKLTKAESGAAEAAEGAEGGIRLSRVRLRIARNDSGAIYFIN